MAYDIRLPNINAQTESGQIEQIKAYLYQFAEQLKYAVEVIEINSLTATQKVKTVSDTVSNPTTEQKIQQFNNLKNLIISSADIVNAYSEKISYDLTGNFVAQSEFGTYAEETNRQMVETANNATENYKKIQDIDGWIRETEGYIKTGYLDENSQQFGIEIRFGSEDEADLKGSVRFTPTRTVFYDSQNQEMAILTNRELLIEGIVCTGNLYVGNFVLSGLSGFSVKPTGRRVTIGNVNN